MNSIREQIIAAVCIALNDPARPADVPEVQRLRTIALTSEQLPAVVLYPVSESVERVNKGPMAKRTLMLRIECKDADLVDGAPVDTKLDAVVAWCTKALAGSRLNGLANEVIEQNATWVVDLKDYVYCTVAIDYAITYTVHTDDQTRR